MIIYQLSIQAIIILTNLFLVYVQKKFVKQFIFERKGWPTFQQDEHQSPIDVYKNAMFRVKNWGHPTPTIGLTSINLQASTTTADTWMMCQSHQIFIFVVLE